MANETELLEESTVEAEEPTLRETIEDAVEETEESSGGGQEGAPEAQEAKTTVTDPNQLQKEPQPTETKVQPRTPETKGTQEGLKAPSQWRPAVREKWNALPREVQEEVLRRESDSMRLIGSVGPKIRLADEVSQHIAPFAQQLQDNGVTPTAFLGDVFSTVKSLSSGTPQEKAAVVANIVQSYGVDLRTLDAILTQRIQAGPEADNARRLAARATAVIQQHESSNQYQTALEAQSTLASFAADPKHEFLDDVRDLMADLIETGRANSLDDAYASAVWAHPDTRKILLQRESQARVNGKNSRAAVARRASSAVHGSPAAPSAGPLSNQNLSLRETIALAMDEQSSP